MSEHYEGVPEELQMTIAELNAKLNKTAYSDGYEFVTVPILKPLTAVAFLSQSICYYKVRFRKVRQTGPDRARYVFDSISD